jgi:hypothetical protein
LRGDEPGLEQRLQDRIDRAGARAVGALKARFQRLDDLIAVARRQIWTSNSPLFLARIHFLWKRSRIFEQSVHAVRWSKIGHTALKLYASCSVRVSRALDCARRRAAYLGPRSPCYRQPELSLRTSGAPTTLS